jgi:hypothetical protein
MVLKQIATFFGWETELPAWNSPTGGTEKYVSLTFWSPNNLALNWRIQPRMAQNKQWVHKWVDGLGEKLAIRYKDMTEYVQYGNLK